MDRREGPAPPPVGNEGVDLRPVLTLLGRKHALELLGALAPGDGLRFTELERRLTISPKSLQSLLTGFFRAGLIGRVRLPGEPARWGYVLTSSGQGLSGIVQRVLQTGGDVPPVRPAPVRWSVEPSLATWATGSPAGFPDPLARR